MRFSRTRLTWQSSSHHEPSLSHVCLALQHGWSGPIKQYMPMKPIKYGIKGWVLADSHTGYFAKFELYTGNSDSPEKGLGSRVVKSLTEPLKHKFHHVYFDNFLPMSSYGKDRQGFLPALKQVKFKER